MRNKMRIEELGKQVDKLENMVINLSKEVSDLKNKMELWDMIDEMAKDTDGDPDKIPYRDKIRNEHGLYDYQHYKSVYGGGKK